MPEAKAGKRPPGRPLWESSVSLCDKADPFDRGIKIAADEGTFRARHLNQRRALFGVFENGNGQRPAIWEQRRNGPEAVDDDQGTIEGGNDRIASDLVGYRIENGMSLPNLWLKAEDEWTSHPLPVQRLTTSGRALDINDARIACGYLDLQIHDRPNRLACAWKVDEGDDSELILLPVPPTAVNAAAIAINNAGTIVGYNETADSKPTACLWVPTGASFEFVDLDTSGVARGINNFGQIVGGSDITSYLWQCGERYDIAEIKGGRQRSRALGIMYTGEVILRDPVEGRMILKPATTLAF
jgi:probable HAF family extracellular repeat protein